jgi:hypothetical protein
MTIEVTSNNPVVKAIIAQTAPRPAQLAAARGALPLPQADLLEALVFLLKSNDAELANSARQTLGSQTTEDLLTLAESKEISPNILAYLAENKEIPHAIHEQIVLNPNTPDDSIINLAKNTADGSLLELISFNQQRLISVPELIDIILKNPSHTPEAERRVTETKREFFEKERGAKQIADELRARGQEAAAEFVEQAEFVEEIVEVETVGKLTVDDVMFLAKYIEVPDAELDDSWLSLEYIEEIYEETEEQREANVKKIIGELKIDGDEVTSERVSMIQKIMGLKMKDRIKYAMKGDREVRTILIRDANRLVCTAVVQNNRITEQEVEKIAAMRTVPEDVLRQIAINRNFARSYAISHNLARNPRTPISHVFTILTRLQTRDLQAMSKNRNISDAVRRQALRFAQARGGR